MELAKNIFFNTDKLLENTKVKISYTGKFFEDNSSDVHLHYGFGLLWDNLCELTMEKTELGFQAEIELVSADTLNFCFRNDLNLWDNNEGGNYIFQIEKAPVELIKTDDLSILKPIKRLKKSYILSKKIKLAIYKIITYVPRLISGNYRKKVV